MSVTAAMLEAVWPAWYCMGIQAAVRASLALIVMCSSCCCCCGCCYCRYPYPPDFNPVDYVLNICSAPKVLCP